MLGLSYAVEGASVFGSEEGDMRPVGGGEAYGGSLSEPRSSPKTAGQIHMTRKPIMAGTL